MLSYVEQKMTQVSSNLEFHFFIGLRNSALYKQKGVQIIESSYYLTLVKNLGTRNVEENEISTDTQKILFTEKRLTIPHLSFAPNNKT